MIFMLVDQAYLDYWPDNRLTMRFFARASDGSLIVAFMDITEAMRFEVIEAQLNCTWLYVGYDPSTRQAHILIGIKNFE